MFKIRKATIHDSKQIGYVHYQSWKETYKGIIDDDFLDDLSLDSRVNSVQYYYENCIVAEVDDLVVGFATSDKTRDIDLENTLEIIGIYILNEYQKKGIGRALIHQSENDKRMGNSSLWVSEKNCKAIEAYKKIGFQIDNANKLLKVGKTELNMIRMIKENKIVG